MANLNIRSNQERTYQAIVIGSGISGAWAAKELCDLGVKTLMLERGKKRRAYQGLPDYKHAPIRV